MHGAGGRRQRLEQGLGAADGVGHDQDAAPLGQPSGDDLKACRRGDRLLVEDEPMAVRRGAGGGGHDRHRPRRQTFLNQFDHRRCEGRGEHRDPAPEPLPQLQGRADPAEGDRVVGVQFVQDEQRVGLLQQDRGVPRPGNRRPQQLMRGGDTHPLGEQSHRPRAGAGLARVVGSGRAVLRHRPGEQRAGSGGMQHADVGLRLARWRVERMGEPLGGGVDGRPVGQHPHQPWPARHSRELGGRPGETRFGLTAAGRRGQYEMAVDRRRPPLMIVRCSQSVEKARR